MKPVIICTEHRGVFFGYTDEDSREITKTKLVALKGAKMAIYFGTTKGVLELAHTGPTKTSKISSPADIELNAVTLVIDVTDQAADVWATS